MKFACAVLFASSVPCLAACRTSESRPASAVLKIDGRANAEVSIAAQDPFVAVAWAAVADGGSTDIYAALSRDGATSFGSPLRVNDTPGDAHVTGEQPPRVVLVPRANAEPSIVVLWTTSRPEGTRLLSARSDDGARTFTRAAVVAGSDAPGNRGWQSAALAPDGHVDVIWLDHRDMKRAAAGQEHGAADRSTHDGVAMAQQSQLFVGSLDGSLDPHSVTRGVCYCCKTAMMAGPDGSLYLTWRQVYPGNIRDIAFTSSHDAGRTFAEPHRVSDDRWVLDGCPENGPALALDANREVHIVWPTLLAAAKPGSEPTLGLFYATSRDEQTFTPRRQLPTHGVPRHPQIAIDRRGTIYAAWDEQEDGTRRVAVATLTSDDGELHVERLADQDATPAVYPAIAPLANGIVIASVSGPSATSAIRVQRATP